MKDIVLNKWWKNYGHLKTGMEIIVFFCIFFPLLVQSASVDINTEFKADINQSNPDQLNRSVGSL